MGHVQEQIRHAPHAKTHHITLFTKIKSVLTLVEMDISLIRLTPDVFSVTTHAKRVMDLVCVRA